MITVVMKRDNRIVPFDKDRLVNAIYKAALSVDKDKPVDIDRCKEMADAVYRLLDAGFASGAIPTVESIQDLVEETLVNYGHYRTAKAYILYRAERTRIRESKSVLMSSIKEIVFTDSEDSDLMRENANISSDSSSGAMYKIGSEASKSFAKQYMMSNKIAQAHDSGLIHIHDLDYYKGINCLQIPAKKLLDTGFVTGYGFLRTPNSIGAYATLMCIIIQSSQNDCFGGQSIPEFEYALSAGVMKSYIQEICAYLECHDIDSDIIKGFKTKYIGEINNDEYVTLLDKYGTKNITDYLKSVIDDFDSKINIDSLLEVCKKHIERDTYQAMEALVHNLNTLASRAGNQVPFSSINFGTGTTEEERMVSRNLLYATEAGLGDGETPIFPISIFRVKDGINYNPGDPNYDLFKLSCQVSAKRLFPK